MCALCAWLTPEQGLWHRCSIPSAPALIKQEDARCQCLSLRNKQGRWMVLLASIGHRTLTFSDKRQQFKIGLSQRENKGTIEWIESFGDRFHYKKINILRSEGKRCGRRMLQEYVGNFCHSNFHSEGRKEGHANQELRNNQAITTRHEELVQELLRSQLFEDVVMYFNPLELCRCVQITRPCCYG